MCARSRGWQRTELETLCVAPAPPRRPTVAVSGLCSALARLATRKSSLSRVKPPGRAALVAPGLSPPGPGHCGHTPITHISCYSVTQPHRKTVITWDSKKLLPSILTIILSPCCSYLGGGLFSSLRAPFSLMLARLVSCQAVILPPRPPACARSEGPGPGPRARTRHFTPATTGI